MHRMAVKQDQDLLEAILGHEDRGAWETLLGRYYPHVFQVALKLVRNETDARDVAQATFLKAIRALPTLRDRARFKPWLLRITVNEARQHHRRTRETLSLDGVEALLAEARRAGVPEAASRREFERELDQVLAGMPEKLKVPLVLHYYQSLSIADVADVLVLPKSTVQSRLAKAVRVLRARLKQRGKSALIPLLTVRFPELATSGGTAALSVVAGASVMKTVVVVVVVAVVGLVTWFLADGGHRHERVPMTRDVGGGESSSGGATLRGDGSREAATAGAAAAQREPGAAEEIKSSGPGVVVGRVVALESGLGLAHASIVLVPSYDHWSNWRMPGAPDWFENRYFSDDAGRFRCASLPVPGTYDLWLRHPDRGYRVVPGVRLSDEEQQVDLGTLPLAEGLAVRGTVANEDGMPIAGAVVQVGGWREALDPLGWRLLGTSLFGARAVSDGHGRFVLRGLARGEHVLAIRAAGFSMRAVSGVRVPQGGPAHYELRVDRAVTGRVLDDRGRAVGGARVKLGLSEQRRMGGQGAVRMSPWAEVRADDDGRFQFEGVPQGMDVELMFDVDVEGHGNAQQREWSRDAEGIALIVARVADRSGVALRVRPTPDQGHIDRMARGRARLRGVVPQTAAYDADRGEFLFERVPPGIYRLEVLLSGYAPNREHRIEVGAEDTEQVVQLSRGQTLEGRVVDASSGEPIEGALVRWTPSPVHRATTGSNGRYELPGVRIDAGTYAMDILHVQAPGYVARRAGFAWPDTKRDTASRDFELVPRQALVALRGRVLDRSSSAVVGARVAIQLAHERGAWHATTTDDDGRYVLAGLNPEHITPTTRIRVTHPSYAPCLEVHPELDPARPVDLVLDRGRVARGRVVDRRGRPFAGAILGVVRARDVSRDVLHPPAGRTSRDDAMWSITSTFLCTVRAGQDGRFELQRVPQEQGLVVVPVHAQARWVADANGRIGHPLRPHGDTDGIELTLWRGQVVRGRVVDPGGLPVARALVRLHGLVVGTRTDASGRFELTPAFLENPAARFSVRHDEHRAEQEVSSDDLSDVRLVAHPIGTVTGRLALEETEPTERHEVRIVYRDGRSQETGVDPSSGFWRLEFVRAVPARLEVWRAGAAAELLLARDIHPKQGRVLEVGDLRLP